MDLHQDLVKRRNEGVDRLMGGVNYQWSYKGLLVWSCEKRGPSPCLYNVLLSTDSLTWCTEKYQTTKQKVLWSNGRSSPTDRRGCLYD